MFSIRNDPLSRVVSLVGRDRDRVFAAEDRLRATRGSIQDFRGASSKRKGSFVDGVPGMDVLRGVYTLTQINHVTIDSLIFRLHSNATVILLVTFSIAITTRQYVGNPIECMHTRDIPEDVLNTYCWIHSTYTVIDAFVKKQGSQVAYPGVDNSQAAGNRNSIKQVKYYQWVAFMLFFQAHAVEIATIIFEDSFYRHQSVFPSRFYTLTIYGSLFSVVSERAKLISTNYYQNIEEDIDNPSDDNSDDDN